MAEETEARWTLHVHLARGKAVFGACPDHPEDDPPVMQPVEVVPAALLDAERAEAIEWKLAAARREEDADKDWLTIVRERDAAEARCQELEEAAGWLLRLKDGPRDERYEREKPLAWAALRAALEGER